MVINVLTMFISLSKWSEHGNSMHITARSFSLVGTETHALDELLRRRNKRVGLRMSDQEPHSTFINELERPKKAALLKKINKMVSEECPSSGQ